jgi:hypothetical protein
MTTGAFTGFLAVFIGLDHLDGVNRVLPNFVNLFPEFDQLATLSGIVCLRSQLLYELPPGSKTTCWKW